MILYQGNTNEELMRAMAPSFLSDAHVYIVVPDRFSLEAETALLQALPEGATTRAEVTTLARIVDRLLPPDFKKISAEGAVMAVTSVMRKLKLECLKEDSFGSTAREVYATICQLAAADVKPQDLDQPIADPALARKTRDLSAIYREYTAFLEDGYCDASSAMAAAANFAAKADWIKSGRFFVLGYDAFTRVGLRLIETIDRHALSLIAGVVKGDFAFGGSAAQKQLATRASVITEVADLLSPLQKVCRSCLEGASANPTPMLRFAREGESLRILQASSSDAAAERIAREIADAVFNGARYRDFGVVCDHAAPLIKAFKEYRIPTNNDAVYCAVSDPLVRLVLNATECVNRHYQTAALRKFAQNPLIVNHDFESWDLYVARYGIRFSAHLSPYEFDDDLNAKTEAERFRKKVIGALADFEKAFAQAQTVAEFIHACRGLLDAYREKADALREEFDADAKDFSAQAEEALDSVLDNLVFCGQEKMSADAFLSLLTAGIRATEIRITPTYADAVNVFNAESFGFRTYRHLYWYGAKAGALPSAKTDCGLLSDTDADRLGAIGAAIEPKIEEVNARARFRVFSTLFIAPRWTAVYWGESPNHFVKVIRDGLLCPVEDAEQTMEGASEAANTLRAAVNPSVAKRAVRRAVDQARARGDRAVNTSVSTLAYVCGVTDEPQIPRKITAGESLFFSNGRTSVSQLERYFNCPYGHFLVYGLRCQERKLAEVRANDVGTFLHAVAENFVRQIPTDDAKCDQVAREIADKLILEDPLLRLKTDEVLLHTARLKEEALALCRGLKFYHDNTSYQTFRTEAEFGEDLPPMAVGRLGVRLCGKIDRIDTLGDKVVVIDYKTGRTNYDLTDVYYGRQIQLFVYMRILTDMGYQPIAALFYPISNDYGKSRVCSGWVDTRRETLEELDHSLTMDQPISAVLPLALNKVELKKGEWRLNASSASFEKQDWSNWLNYTKSLSDVAVNEICDGYVAPSPLSLGWGMPCDYCPGRSACVDKPCVRYHSEKIKRDSVVACRAEKGEKTDG